MKKLLGIDIVILLLSSIFFILACKKTTTVVHELQLEDTSVTIKEGETEIVKIISGNGSYYLSSSEIVDAEVSGDKITLRAKTHGKVVLTVTDEAGKAASLEVIVTSTILDSSIDRFVWGTVIELEKANNWGTTIFDGRIAITNTEEKKQYIVTWIGGESIGVKSGATLKILESGKPPQTLSLTKLEILGINENRYSILFANENRTGELLFTK